MYQKIFLSIATCVAIIAILFSIFAFKASSSTGFIVTQSVFEQFNGTKDIQKRVDAQVKVQRVGLDSLEGIVAKLKQEDSTSIVYQKAEILYMNRYEVFRQGTQQLLKEHEEGIWKQINQYVIEYGKVKGYDYIYGTNGLGSLMYAKDSKDITKEVLIFINQKYENEK